MNEAYNRLRSAQLQERVEFAPAQNIIDEQLAGRMSTQRFYCTKESIDLACVPIEHLLPQK